MRPGHPSAQPDGGATRLPRRSRSTPSADAPYPPDALTAAKAVALVGRHLVAARATSHGVAAAVADRQAVVPRSGEQPVVAAARLQGVIAASSVQAVASGPAGQPIASGPAVQPIVAAAHEATPGHTRPGGAAVAEKGVVARKS